MDSGEREYLEARINDSVRRCGLRSVPAFVGFLDASGAALAEKIGRRERAVYKLYGGYDGAERLYFGVFPEWCEPDIGAFPIVRLKITNKSRNEFTHRDVLGTIMSLGLERDTVGDIIVGGRESFVFVSDFVSQYIITQLTKIASCGVEITADSVSEMPAVNRFSEGSDTIASARLDCVAAALGNFSRSSAAEVISAGMVSVNGTETLKPTVEIAGGDIISIRKRGRFIVDAISDRTKKGRIILKYRKYI